MSNSYLVDGAVAGTGSSAPVDLSGLRLVQLPDATGHLPAGSEQLYSSGVPGIVGHDVLQLSKETTPGHSAQAFWDEVSQAGDQIETPAAVQWVTGTDYAVGARIIYTAAGVDSYYVCIKAHTAGSSPANTVIGTVASFEFWTPYTRLDLANFIGVHQRVSDVDSPADNAWGYFVYNNFVAVEQYHSSGGVLGWLPITIGPGTDTMLGFFRSEAEATSDVHAFNSSNVTVAVFPNASGEHRLHYLLAYIPPADEQTLYPWRPGHGDILDGRGNVGLGVPAEDGSDDLSLKITDNGVYWVRHTVHPFTRPTGDWVQYADATLLGDGQYNYIPAVTEAGRHAFFNGGWWESEYVSWTSSYSWIATQWRPANWRGRFNSRDEALDHALLAGSNGVYATGNAIEVLSNFVAASQYAERRAWDPVNAAGGWAENDYWYESGDITDDLAGLDTVEAEAPAGFAVSITNTDLNYPFNPPPGVIGIVLTLWTGGVRINTGMRSWGSQYNTTRLYGTDAVGGQAYIQFDPDESAHDEGTHRLSLGKSPSLFPNFNFNPAVRFRIHPLYASGGVSGLAATAALTAGSGALLGTDATVSSDPADTFNVTTVDVPAKADYAEGFINFGVVAAGFRDGEWRPFLVADLHDEIVAALNHAIPNSTNSISFFGVGDGTNIGTVRVGRTAAGKFLIATSNTALDPGNPVRVRAK